MLGRVARRVFDGPVLDAAAQLAFYAALALAPFLVVLTTLAALVPTGDTVAKVLGRAEALMPPQAYALLCTVVDDAVKDRSPLFFAVGLLTALWSASRAVNALRKAVNDAWGREDARSWVRQQLIAVAFTVCGAVLLVFSVVATLAGASAIAAAAHVLKLEVSAQAVVWAWVRWPLAVVSLIALAALAYRVLPDTRPPRRAVFFGAVVATALFIAASVLFSAFARGFNSFGITFGAMAGVAALLMWIWLSAIAFVVGGEVAAATSAASDRPARAAPAPASRRATPARQGLS